MKKYKQLSYEERVTIKICLWKKMSINEIARNMGRSPSTISREIKRGITIDGTYFAESTERELRRKKLNDKRKRIMDNPVIYAYVECRLKNKLSPAIIQSDIERDVGLKIGKDAIYEYIYRFKYNEWFKYLTRKKKYNYKKYKGKKKVTENYVNKCNNFKIFIIGSNPDIILHSIAWRGEVLVKVFSKNADNNFVMQFI